MEDEEEDVLHQWIIWLQAYAKGDERPPPAPRSRASGAKTAAPTIPDFAVPLYPRGPISLATARTVAEFYNDYGFLPPPRADEENVRLLTIQEYNLFRQDQLDNFHRCSSVASAFFDDGPICCTISLFHNDSQVIVSKAGETSLQLGECIVTETSICGHVVLKKQTTELNEVAEDWRFAGNPRVSNDDGVKGYIGVPITLEVDPLIPSDSERVTVGVIAIMSNQMIPKLTNIRRMALDHLSGMLSVQLRSTWEGWRRSKEAKFMNTASSFLHKALVDPTQGVLFDAADTNAQPALQGSEAGQGRRTPGNDLRPTTLFADAARQLHELLEVDLAIILYVESHGSKDNNAPRRRWHDSHMDDQANHAKPRSSCMILGSCSTGVFADYDKRFLTADAMVAIANFLDEYATTGFPTFSSSEKLSGLESLLSNPVAVVDPQRGSPPSPENTPHIAIPLYTADRPTLLIIVASAAPYFMFKPSDHRFVGNLGIILVAHLAQNLIVQADAAKTAFISQIRYVDSFQCKSSGSLPSFSTHELRTPLHGLLGQLELMRDGIASEDWAMLSGLLDSAEYCGGALGDIVDDVLDFGKTRMAYPTDESTDARIRLVDLSQIVLEASRSCWTRQLQRARHTASGPVAASPLTTPPPVELVVEHEDRTGLQQGWLCTLDRTGFIRILHNLVTNSLTYTSKGSVTVSLMSGVGPDKTGHVTPQLTLKVEDSGLGIAPAFLPKLFDPFTQADIFSSGAGLGLFICNSVVSRMNGEITVESRLGIGSIFTVVLPVLDIEIVPADTALPMQRTVISTTIKNMDPVSIALTPAQKIVVKAPSPTNGATDARQQDQDGHLKILVVDDNAISRRILVAMLKHLNTTVHQADDGISALNVFREVHPHVVWTDVSMPRMDGVTAAKEMRRIEQENGWIPAHIVAITGLGHSNEYIRKEALLGPAALDGWLIKGQNNMKILKESLGPLRQKFKS